MGIEVERKFLVEEDGWRPLVSESWHISQGYLAASDLATMRVRIVEKDAWLTIKSAGPSRVRQEFEYAIPIGDATEIFRSLTHSSIEKERHKLEMPSSATWTIDEFAGANLGLLVLEIEGAEDIDLTLPSWVGLEVTDDRRFYNDELSRRPVADWSPQEKKAAGVRSTIA